MLTQESARFIRGSKPLGQLLQESGHVHPSMLSEALEIQKTRGGLVGSILMEMGACTSDCISHALLRQSPVVLLHPQTFTQDAVGKRKTVAGIRLSTRPAATVGVLVAFDLLFLMASVCASIVMHWLIWSSENPEIYANLWPVGLLFLSTFAMQDLYWVAPQNPADEIRRTTLSLTSIYLTLAAATFLFQHDVGYSRAVFLMSWIFSIVLIPVGRALVRGTFSGKKWWGHPVVVIGSGEAGRTIVKNLQRQPSLGLKPVALLDETAQSTGRVSGVPILNDLEMGPILADALRVKYAIVAMPEANNHELMQVIEKHVSSFPHVLVIPNLLEFSSLQVPGRDVGGVLGLCVRQQLLLPGPRIAKRIIDVIMTVVGGVLILPILALIAALIKLDSRGPVLYTQNRLGKNGRIFKAYKFRTMFGDGEQRLQELLDSDPKVRMEYEVFHKIKNDPRVTRIGYYLRKYSLDELPQLWNVLMNEMSLVGPRPYLEREVPDMDAKEAIILKCVPGLTGLWQVSARNGASFSHRLEMDVHYVRNWSPWLDIYLLASTFHVVIKGTGS